MPFQYKLARRIARLRTVSLVACATLSVACEPNDNTLGPPDSSAVSALDAASRRNDPSSGTGAGWSKTLSISPQTALLAPGASQGFTARTKKNRSTSDLVVTWSADGGTVTSTGLYVAPTAPGRYRVIAKASNAVTDTALVSVEAAPSGDSVAAIVLTPATASLVTGTSQAFTALALLRDSTTAPATVSYSASGGTITAAGVYTAGRTPGVYSVIGKSSTGQADTAAVSVTAPVLLQRISLTPTSATVLSGGTVRFAATGVMSDGSDTTVSVTFGASGGTITSTGLYTAGSTTGTYRVVATVAGGTLADTAAVAVTSSGSQTGVAAVPADSFVNSIGVATHFNYTDTPYVLAFSTVQQRIAELGIRHIRDGGWNSGFYSRVNALKQQNGVDLLAVCDVRDLSAAACRDNIKANLLGTAVAVEGPNEYDGTGTGWETRLTDYMSQLRPALKNDPATAGMPIVAGALLGYSTSVQLGSYIDFGNEHPLRFFSPDSRQNQTSTNIWGETLHRSQQNFGGKRMWASETGYPTCPYGDGVTERAQGKYVPRFYLAWFMAGVFRTYMYEFMDEHADPAYTDKTCEWHMGMVRSDGSPKPAFTAMKNLIGLLKDPGTGFTPGKLSFALAGDTTKVLTLLMQKRDGRFYLAIWQTASVYGQFTTEQDIVVPDRPLTLTLGAPAAGIRVYRPNQGATPIQTGSGASIALQVPDEPLVVEITP